MCDSNSELPHEIQEAYHIPYIPMPNILGGQEIGYDLGKNADLVDFYAQVRAGAMPKTMTLPPQFYEDFWRPILQSGQDILFLTFSSGLSGAYDLVNMAREHILEEFPDRRIELVDTLSISMGAGLLVYYAIQQKEQGASLDDIAGWVRSNRLRMNHWFVVDDLNHLRRGGRLSAAAATVGTMLDLKPMITVNREGKLVPTEKIRGKKKVLRTLAQRLEERIEHPEEQVVVIMHADCEDQAEALKAMILEKVRPKEIWIRMVGPVIGTHAGPGTMAVLFLGQERAS